MTKEDARDLIQSRIDIYAEQSKEFHNGMIVGISSALIKLNLLPDEPQFMCYIVDTIIKHRGKSKLE